MVWNLRNRRGTQSSSRQPKSCSISKCSSHLDRVSRLCCVPTSPCHPRSAESPRRLSHSVAHRRDTRGGMGGGAMEGGTWEDSGRATVEGVRESRGGGWGGHLWGFMGKGMYVCTCECRPWRAPFFLPWNQVDLILRKSGQPFFGPLYFKLGPFWKIRAALKNHLKIN